MLWSPWSDQCTPAPGQPGSRGQHTGAWWGCHRDPFDPRRTARTAPAPGRGRCGSWSRCSLCSYQSTHQILHQPEENPEPWICLPTPRLMSCRGDHAVGRRLVCWSLRHCSGSQLCAERECNHLESLPCVQMLRTQPHESGQSIN